LVLAGVVAVLGVAFEAAVEVAGGSGFAPHAAAASASAANANFQIISLCYLLQVSLEGGDGLIEHPAVRIRTRQIAVGSCLGQRQLDRFAPVRAFTLVGGQSPSERFLASGFSLLKLDVFTLEAASHLPVF
jgi:hypothetical protein